MPGRMSVDQNEMIKRCHEAVQITKDKTPGIVGGIFGGMIFDCSEWVRSGHENLYEIERQIGRCYAALKMLEIYTKATEEGIAAGVEDVLSYQ